MIINFIINVLDEEIYMNDHYKFVLKPLEYDYDVLEPYIDAETVRIHHNKHLQTYVDNLNKALYKYQAFHTWSLEKLIVDNCRLPKDIQTAVRHNAGGVYNHNFYFDIMTKNSTKKPVGILESEINKQFSCFEILKEKLISTAFNQFGSGWGWLVCDKKGILKIISTQNQDTPLTMNLCPILLVDVWEHAYYLKYQNRRQDYLDNWFNIIDWEKVNLNYIRAVNR